MTRVVVTIPWRHSTVSRLHNLSRVCAFYREQFPNIPVLFADDPEYTEFNRAAARNAAVRMAEEVGAEVVVVCDADTLPEPDALRTAITASLDGRVHLPYTRCDLLNEDGSVWESFKGSLGGVYVVLPRVWWAVGGQDVRFRGWGFEDVAFAVAADALIAPIVRHEGLIRCLWHPTGRQPETRQFQDNQRLCNAYTQAGGDSGKIREVQETS